MADNWQYQQRKTNGASLSAAHLDSDPAAELGRNVLGEAIQHQSVLSGLLNVSGQRSNHAQYRSRVPKTDYPDGPPADNDYPTEVDYFSIPFHEDTADHHLARNLLERHARRNYEAKAAADAYEQMNGMPNPHAPVNAPPIYRNKRLRGPFSDETGRAQGREPQMSDASKAGQDQDRMGEAVLRSFNTVQSDAHYTHRVARPSGKADTIDGAQVVRKHQRSQHPELFRQQVPALTGAAHRITSFLGGQGASAQPQCRLGAQRASYDPLAPQRRLTAGYVVNGPAKDKQLLADYIAEAATYVNPRVVEND